MKDYALKSSERCHTVDPNPVGADHLRRYRCAASRIPDGHQRLFGSRLVDDRSTDPCSHQVAPQLDASAGAITDELGHRCASAPSMFFMRHSTRDLAAIRGARPHRLMLRQPDTDPGNLTAALPN